ncbi:hypothetical protein X798_00050, partial [Onchocerca flexuosa]
ADLDGPIGYSTQNAPLNKSLRISSNILSKRKAFVQMELLVQAQNVPDRAHGKMNKLKWI